MLISRPLVKGNEDAGYEGARRPLRLCCIGLAVSSERGYFWKFFNFAVFLELLHVTEAIIYFVCVF